MGIYAKVDKFGHDHYLKINEVLHHEVTGYQEILIAMIPHYGKTLVLNDELQSSTKDQSDYHEALIGLPYEPRPHEKCLVIGSGEGVSVDLLLRKKWQHIDAIEIDERAVEIYSQYLSDWNNHVYKRTDEYNLIIGDGLQHLRDTPDNFYSLIVIDTPSDILLAHHEEWIGESLRCLLPNGVLTIQDGDNTMESYSFNMCQEIFESAPFRMGKQDWSFLHTVKNQDTVHHIDPVQSES